MNVRHILVPVDFSPHSEQALNHAVFWAEQLNARMTLLHVNTLFGERHNYDELIERYREVIEAEEQRAHAWLQERHRQIAHQKLPVRYEIIRAARPANAILEYSKNHNVDLIFMGTHGWSGAPAVLIGDVLDRVLRLSEVPVVTVHQNHEQQDIRHILVPIDFSKYSEKVVKDAAVLASLFDATVHLLYVVEKENAQSLMWLGDIRLALQDVDEAFIQRVEEELERFITPDLKPRVQKVVRVGRPYEQIETYAKEAGVDLIVMAIRGYSRFEYFWSFGSNTERVVKAAPCPVLVTGWKKTDPIGE